MREFRVEKVRIYSYLIPGRDIPRPAMQRALKTRQATDGEACITLMFRVCLIRSRGRRWQRSLISSPPITTPLTARPPAAHRTTRHRPATGEGRQSTPQCSTRAFVRTATVHTPIVTTATVHMTIDTTATVHTIERELWTLFYKDCRLGSKS